MSRAIAEGIDLEALADSLGAMAAHPAPTAATPEAEAAILEGKNGWKAKFETCPKHRIDVRQIWCPEPFNVWMGECPECKREAAQDKLADEELAKHRHEIHRQVSEALPSHEADIQKRADDELEAYVQNARPAFADEIRERVREDLFNRFAGEHREQILAELRAKENA